MHDTVIKLKDGRTLCGPIWEFRPKEGYLTIASDDEDGKIFFRDMLSCITLQDRIGINKTADVDEIQRAREEGWEGD
jgi:hypothetical protein